MLRENGYPSDNHWRYRAIRQALKQYYLAEPSGRMAQHLTPLAAFTSGIVGSKGNQLPTSQLPESESGMDLAFYY